MQVNPTLYVVAGPNGCGKSGFTKARLSGFPVIDPDAIARRLAPEAPQDAAITAAREALREQRAAVAANRPFVVETTLSGGSPVRLMTLAKAKGYRLELHFMCVNSAEEALDRIASRVAQGGHSVPATDVRRRFVRSQANLAGAIAQADEARLYDNSNIDEPYRVVAVLTATERWLVADPPEWMTRALDNVSL